MPLPPKLTKFSTASEVIASYDFFDFAQGVGIKQFYAAVMVGPTYKLTTNIIFSNTGGGLLTSGSNNAGDFDFDGEFETTIDIGGDCVIQVPVVGFQSGGSYSSLITITLFHVAGGGAETSLGTFNRTVSGTPGAGVGEFFSVTGTINIARTTLKNGEKLRLNLVNSAAGASNLIYFGVDPANRIASAPAAAQYFETTRTIVNLPIVI